MKIENWKIFDKNGNKVSIYLDPKLPVDIQSDAQNTKKATAFIATNQYGEIDNVKIEDSGFLYDPSNIDISIKFIYDNSFNRDLSISEYDIEYLDVPIFNPDEQITKGIKSLNINIPDVFLYPSITFSGVIFLKPVSVDLVETEHLYIVEEIPLNLIRPFDTDGKLVVKWVNSETDYIKLFNLNEDSQEIEWSNEIIYDLSEFEPHTPLTINIGFKSPEAGVFERKLRFYNRVNNKDYLIGEILVNAEAIEYEERFDTHINNFDLPDPKTFPQLFKEVDIKEDKPDWKFLNRKAKHLILEYDKIIPYIGTYKGIINAIKWLGYTDIQIKEWF